MGGVGRGGNRGDWLCVGGVGCPVHTRPGFVDALVCVVGFVGGGLGDADSGPSKVPGDCKIRGRYVVCVFPANTVLLPNTSSQ